MSGILSNPPPKIEFHIYFRGIIINRMHPLVNSKTLKTSDSGERAKLDGGFMFGSVLDIGQLGLSGLLSLFNLFH